MVLDNYQRGNQLREQRSGRSSKFSIGTTEAAHRVRRFLNFTWDQQNMSLTYKQDQIVPAPIGIRSYEAIDFMSESLGTILFTNHRLIPISPEPCFEGTLVAAYEKAIRIRRHIISIRHSLCHQTQCLRNNCALFEHSSNFIFISLW
jgi:hypothetical protein